jgi:enoyl-CoA hydratase/carnithine racemase
MVTCSKKESVATITLSRPDAKNAINTQVAAELKDIRDEICQDETIKIVIITAIGKEVFCVGTDLEEFYAFENIAKRLELFSVASTIDTFDRPVIAAIGGDTFGQGLELALACDLRICSENARFGMHQVTDGQMPWDGGTQRLSRLVGKGNALEMILLGETIDAVKAHRIGLVHQVVSPAELMQVAVDLAHKMACMSPISLSYAKEAVKKGMDLTLEQGLRLEADLYYLMHTARDRTEGIKAFQEKRRPQFKGE